MSTAHGSTFAIKEQWKTYMEVTEDHYLKDTAAVDSGKKCLEGLRDCKAKAIIGAQQWRDAQNSLLKLDKGNVASVDSIIRSGLEANQLLRSKLSSAASSTLEDVDISNNDLLSSIDYCFKLDQDANANFEGMLVPCHDKLRELRCGHYNNIVEITDNTEKCLGEDYMVDVPSCSTPKRRPINLPGASCIEDIRAPDFEELLRPFRVAIPAAPKQANGDVKNYDSQLQSKDPRLPLTSIN